MNNLIKTDSNGEVVSAARVSNPAALPGESLVQILGRRYKIILGAVAVCAAAALIYILTTAPVYTSTAQLYVEQRGPKIITEQEGFWMRSTNYLYTQCELLSSTPILKGVIDKPEAAQLKTFDDSEAPIMRLKKNMQVELGKKDDIIRVSFESPYPSEAAKIVNAIVDSYTEYHAARQRNTAGEVLKILHKEKSRVDEDMKAKHSAIIKFMQENSVLSLEDRGGNILIQDLARFTQALTEARIETINAKTTFETARMMTQKPSERLQFIAAQRSRSGRDFVDAEAMRMRGELNRLQLELAGRSERLTADHPTIKNIMTKMEHLEAQIEAQEKTAAEAYLDQVRQDWIIARQKEEELQAALDSKRDLSQELNVKVFEHAMLQSELNRAKEISALLDKRIKEIYVTENVGALNVSVLEKAQAAKHPSQPVILHVTGIALALGLVLGVGGALLHDWRDHRLRTIGEMSALVDMPVLGTIPAMRGNHDIAMSGRKVLHHSNSHIAEAYRNIRTALYFGLPKGNAKTMLITSPTPGDGKSTLVSNLAIAMAQAGQRTLVVDCDFRKPKQHSIFEIDEEAGISDVLTGQKELEAVIQKTSQANLHLLPCGSIPDNPSELLSSPAFEEAIKELAGKYDRVLIDSPAVMSVTDARILGAMCDVTLLTLRVGKSTREACMQARNGLLSVGANVLGIVVNDVNPRDNRYDYVRVYIQKSRLLAGRMTNDREDYRHDD